MVYEGNEKYIFISYAHKDSEKVIPIVNAMIDNGYRVWYDSGIEAGTEWPEYIEDHLMNSEVVVVFMTPSAIESRNCRNEINFALELKKEILVVYLEETTLIKGMRLQLNSTQSLFRMNHNCDETFLHELLTARVLGCCHKDKNVQETIPQKPKAPVINTASNISNICSIGTNDENDLWPSGTYSPTINRDTHRVVFFHVDLVKPIGFTGSVSFDKRIYNSSNNLIFEDNSTIAVEPTYDKFSTGWILRGLDGSYIPSGEYRFVCSVNNSPEFTYMFNVTSNADIKPKKRGLFGWLKNL